MNVNMALNRIRYLDFPKICRFCLKGDIATPIFKQGQNEYKSLVDVPSLILTYTTIEVNPDDDLPMFLCQTCFDKLIECHQFRQQCISSMKLLQKVKLEYHKIKCEKDDVSDIDNDSSEHDRDMMPAEIHTERFIKAETLEVFIQEEKELLKKKPCKDNTQEKQTIRDKRKQKKDEKNIKKAKKEQKGKRTKARYICQICGASVVSLTSHMQSMHMEKKYDIECDICGKKYVSIGRLNEHMRMIHIDERKFKCSVCPNAFNAKYILAKHMLTHTGEKNFRCDTCDRAFRAKETLTKHRLSHTQERTFSCNYCDKQFSSNKSLRNHIVVHTGERPHKCGLCPMTFKFSSTASQHRKAHVNRQPYQCQPCGMNFNSFQLYRTHMKIHKNDKTFSSVDIVLQNN